MEEFRGFLLHFQKAYYTLMRMGGSSGMIDRLTVDSAKTMDWEDSGFQDVQWSLKAKSCGLRLFRIILAAHSIVWESTILLEG